MKCVFQMEAQKEFTTENIRFFLKDKVIKGQEKYIHDVTEKVSENIDKIDELLNLHSTGWPVSRMGRTDLAISRVAVCEILYIDDVPKSVAINEAVELAKIYGSDQSPAFINAILKGIGPS